MKNQIKRFKEINEFFETTGFEKRTDIPEFFIFRFDELSIDSALKMPPYQKDFYQVTLITDSLDAIAGIDDQTDNKLENTLYFLSPEHIFSWQRNIETTGFIVYFKPEFLDFFRGNFKNEFSLFSLANRNFLKLDKGEVQYMIFEFEKLYKDYYTKNSYRIQILQSTLLSFLFKCRSLEETKNEATRVLSTKEDLVNQFRNLVSNSYIKHKKVSDYADLLGISSNSLNQKVKSISGKTAKEVITETIIREAKRRIKYTSDDIAEIAYFMGFDEPTHFIRFFKNDTGLTPLEYRNSKM